MKNYRHIDLKTLFFKTILYRLLSGIFTFFVIFLFTKNISISFGAGLFVELLKGSFYFLFDFYFAKKFKVSHDEGFTLWATGPSGAGKTTLLDALKIEIKKHGRQVQRLDGDLVRQDLCSDLGFSKQDRDKNIKRVSFVANLLSKNGVATLCSFISPYKKTRDYVRARTTNFIELYLYADKEALIKRDPKGLYKKAIKGEIKNLTGYDGVYEVSEKPELVINTKDNSLDDSVKIVIDYLKKRKLI